MNQLFGTDGIRGAANSYPITAEIALKVGRAVAYFFKENGNAKIIIGKDTRISGCMIEHAIAAGICSMGAAAHLVGVVPTPQIAFMTNSMAANAGIVVSASHNPFYDNGIKIFNKNGRKLSEKKEEELEQLVLNDTLSLECESIKKLGEIYKIGDKDKTSYFDFLTQSPPNKVLFKGMKVVLDCANGATYRIAPKIFNHLEVDCKIISNQPNGTNINQNCGSQYPKILAKKVVEERADVGFAFDGDGDRVVAVDEKGNAMTGDQMLAIFAKAMKKQNTLKNNIVVSTIMSNMGLGVALREMGIEHFAAKVGDRYVMEKMISLGAVLGGEDSGHIILSEHHTTGDGILAALKLLEIMQFEQKPLSELAKIMTVFPQALINVEVSDKPNLDDIPDIKNAIKSIEEKLNGQGRTLVRYSGTQPLCRVMVEGASLDETNRYCRQIADLIYKIIGKPPVD